MRTTWIGIVALALAGGLGGCVNRAAQDQARQTERIVSDPARPVTVQPARQETVVERLEITGDVTTSQDTQVGAKVPGRVAMVYVKDGDPVTAGQVLATLDTSTFLAQARQAQAEVQRASSQAQAAQAALAQALQNARVGPARSSAEVRRAQAAVRAAQSQLQKAVAGARPQERRQAESAVRAARSAFETAQTEYNRVERLVREGAVARARLDTARNNLEAARSGYENVRQALELVRAGTREEDISAAREAVRQAQEGLSQARSSKQLDVVLRDQVDAARAQVQTARAGVEAARAGLSLAQQSLADALIRAPFSGRVAGKPIQPGAVVAPGTPVLRLIGTGGVYFEGQVTESAVTQVSAGKPVQVTVAALPGRTFPGRVVAVSPVGGDVARLFQIRVEFVGGLGVVRPGMFARGVVELRRVPNATVVPASAVVGEGDNRAVFAVEGDKARRYRVKVGIAQGTAVQVTGLPVGAQVVVRGQEGLQEGAVVRVENAQGGPEVTAAREG